MPVLGSKTAVSNITAVCNTKPLDEQNQP